MLSFFIQSTEVQLEGATTSTTQNSIAGDEREAGLYPVSVPSLLESGKEFLTKNHTSLRYAKRVKRVTLQRFLVSKVVYEPEAVTFQDTIVLYDNLLWLQDKSASDENFSKKFGSSLEELTKILKQFNFNSKTYKKSLYKLSKNCKESLENFYFPKRNYPSIKERQRQSFRFVLTTPEGTINSQLPPVQYIGKGYRDKGTARNPAYDGNPSWQEVAAVLISESTVDQYES